MKQSMAAFLSLQTVFKFSCLREIHRIALPNQFPRSLPFGPFGPARIVLFDSSRDIVGHTDVKLSLVVLDNVNAIDHRGSEKLVAGAGFEPATFRL